MDKKEMRLLAEERLQNQKTNEKDILDRPSWNDVDMIVHDLRVHQIELEMQNEELRRIQVELDESKSHFIDIFELAPDGYLIVSDKGIIQESNLTAVNMLGFVRSQFLNTRFSKYICKEDIDVYYLKRIRLFESKTSQTCDLRLKRNDGTIIWVHMNATISVDNGILVCRMILSDISEVMQAKLNLETSQMLLKASLNSPKDMIIFAIDKDYHYLYFNQAHEDTMLYAYKQEVKVGMNIMNAITSLVDKVNAKNSYDLALSGIPLTTIHKYGDLDNSFYESSYNPIYNDEQEIIGATCFSRNITDRMEAQNKLRESEEKYRLLYSSMSQGSALHEIITDNQDNVVNYRFLSVNASFERLMGLKSDEIIGKTVLELFPDTENYWIQSYGKVALTGIAEQFEKFSNELGRYFSVKVYCPRPRQFAVLIDDITDRKKKEEEILYIYQHDFLTDLYNRRFYVESFEKLNTPSKLPMGIMMFDVNGLKIINDAYGHTTGDTALKAVADVLKETFESKDIVARIGGDEFAILLPNTTVEKMQGYKDSLQVSIANKDIKNVILSLAIGFEIMTDSTKTLDELLKYAENHMYRHKVAEGVSVRNRAIKAILCTLTEKYEPERIHCERVSAISHQIGEALNLRQDDLNELTMAGMFHDIGKISIPDVILEKTGKLSLEEFEIIKNHTEIGYQILRAADQYSDFAIHALSHHERWDGLGYPQGLKGEQIPLYSRIIGVADAFEAMTAERPYKKAMTTEEAKKELTRCSGSQFDPEIVKVFVQQVLTK